MRPNLATLLDDFRRHGRQTAVVRMDGVRRVTTSYGELANWAARFAALLVERNIVAGDRVVLWGANSAEWTAAFFGCVLRGVLVAPLDAHGAPEFADRVCADVQPRLIVGDAELLRNLHCDREQLAFERFLGELPQNAAAAAPGLARETPLQILFTSGTTGNPKGVVHTHGNVLASLTSIETEIRKYQWLERPFHPLRFLHTLPFSHVFGQFMGLWIPPLLAAELHLDDQPVVSAMAERICREQISLLAAVPRVLSLLAAHLESEVPGLQQRLAAGSGISAWKRWWRFRDIHRLFGYKFWTVITGGGALPENVEQFWSGLGFVVVQGYGMTETTALITLNHPLHVAKGTLGKPLPGREVQISPEGEVLVRGEMIAGSTWERGGIRKREGAWLPTGDLAQQQATGELRFLGRKSEVIVTAAGLNIHPEDLEAALERQAGVRACAVVPVETAAGPGPFAVIAFAGDRGAAERAVEQANQQLAEFQRIRRWELWPGPDLPRTSSGKVKRREVSEWLQQQSRTEAGATGNADWLLSTIQRTTGEPAPGGGDERRLDEDLHLDSLGRVQLAAEIERRTGTVGSAAAFEQVKTLGDLRAWAGVGPQTAAADEKPDHQPIQMPQPTAIARKFIYPRWPWSWPMRVVRAVFTEAVMRPLVWLLARPRVRRGATALPHTPTLILANHVTAYDVPLLLYGLPRDMRVKVAVAMSGEMLEDFRHGRNQSPRWLNPLGPLAYALITALFNVFPLPRSQDFQRSFAHAGDAMDHGFHVLVFPEGTRSRDSKLHDFRQGIGLLVLQTHASVLPMAISGLDSKGWFHAGKVEIRAGEPMQFDSADEPRSITSRLHEEIAKLLGNEQ